MQWGQAGKIRKYTFTYDNLSRLKTAAYTGESPTNFAASYSYDKQGNMLTLQRYGKKGAGTNTVDYGLVDNLTAEGRNEYTYSASGAKLKAVQRWNPNYNTAPVIGSDVNAGALTKSISTDYAGNIIYEDGTLKRILVDGGYYERGKYYFYITDYLDNNRIVADAAASVVQSTQYYPFGMPFADGMGQDIQPYKYNGKELDQMHGLNLYDYSARYYESAIGRFISVDPHAENYYGWSPYAWVGNNPMKIIDPTGMDWYQDDKGNVMWQEGNDKTVTKTYEGENGSFTTTYTNIGESYSTTVTDEDGVDVNVQYNQMNVVSTTYADDANIGGMILSGIAAYSDNYHDHLHYKAGNGEIKSLYKGKNILKPRSLRAKDYIRWSNTLKAFGHLSNGVMGGTGIYNAWNGSTNPLDYTDAIAGTSAIVEAMAYKIMKTPVTKVPVVGEVVGIYGALRLSWDIGRVWGPVYGGDAWVRWYRESQQQKSLIPLVKPR